MEFNIGKKTIKISKRTAVRGVVTFTAGAGAYIIIRRVVKNNIPPESLTVLGKVAVTVGTFFLADLVSSKVGESSGKFFDDCVDAYEGANKVAKDIIDDINQAKEAV